MRARVPRRGEIWSGYTPGQPDDPQRTRPLLVISVDIRNQRSDDVIVIPIFSRGLPGPTRVPLAAGMGGIRNDSVLFCDEVTTIDQDFLTRGPFGPPVPAHVLQHVIRAVRRALGEVIPAP